MLVPRNKIKPDLKLHLLTGKHSKYSNKNHTLLPARGTITHASLLIVERISP